MKKEIILRVLKRHSISTKVENLQVFALDEYLQHGVIHSEWVNVTNYTREQIKDFLNY